MAYRSNRKFNIGPARIAIEKIRALNLASTSISEIKKLLVPLFKGRAVTAPIFLPGLNLYSGRLGVKPSNINELKSFPTTSTIASRDGDPMFYCSSMRQAVFFELLPEVGDTLTIVSWATTSRLTVNHVGYSKAVFQALGSVRAVPQWEKESTGVDDVREEVNDFLAEIFTQISSSDFDRKLSVAVAEKLLGGDVLDGLVYPTLRMGANADNFALKPSFMEKHLRFMKAEFIRIKAIRDFQYDVNVLDTAPEIGSDGTIHWYKRSHDSKVALPLRYGTIGWEEFLRQKKDILSDYDSAKETNANRPLKTEHGNVAEASFRKWLSEYLPKKYAVTSGFIIPDVRTVKYVIRHYDVIIYDVLNSPVLWGSNNPDKSEHGRERAIPAKYVHAVFEVKAAFTKSSINDALTKLKELSDYKDHLPDHFVSGTAFFEVRKAEQSSCKLAEELFRENIPGYFGGIILRAEGVDPNLTGYYQLLNSDLETKVNLPLVQEIGDLKRNDDGNPQLGPGEATTAYSFDGIWHFDKGYMPSVKNVLVWWAYNSFPMFFIDFLERLQGTYRQSDSSDRGAYGLSFAR